MVIGLSRHADHHAWASRPYQQRRYWEESPKLRYGYFGTVVLLLTRNARFRELMTEEPRRRRLVVPRRRAGDLIARPGLLLATRICAGWHWPRCSR